MLSSWHLSAEEHHQAPWQRQNTKRTCMDGTWSKDKLSCTSVGPIKTSPCAHKRAKVNYQKHLMWDTYIWNNVSLLWLPSIWHLERHISVCGYTNDQKIPICTPKFCKACQGRFPRKAKKTFELQSHRGNINSHSIKRDWVVFFSVLDASCPARPKQLRYMGRASFACKN